MFATLMSKAKVIGVMSVMAGGFALGTHAAKADDFSILMGGGYRPASGYQPAPVVQVPAYCPPTVNLPAPVYTYSSPTVVYVQRPAPVFYFHATPWRFDRDHWDRHDWRDHHDHDHGGHGRR